MKKLLRINRFMALMAIVCGTMSCSKGDLALLTTYTITETGMRTATSGGNISSDGGADIKGRGVCWAESENPTTADSKTSDGSGTGYFSSHLTGLKPGTKYYLRAYAINSAGTSYGNTLNFTTCSVEDIDGNGYSTVNIGTQVWMAQNLKATHFQNGDAILNASSDDQWSSASEPAFCYYQNDISNASVYGNLYNFYTAQDSRNVCPAGWHVPTMDDWITLFSFLGNEFTADVKIREAGTDHWIKDTGADNSTGFTYLPAGDREPEGKFFNQTTGGYIWASTEWIENDVIAGWLIQMGWDRSQVTSCQYSRSFGASIRCIKN